MKEEGKTFAIFNDEKQMIYCSSADREGMDFCYSMIKKIDMLSELEDGRTASGADDKYRIRTGEYIITVEKIINKNEFLYVVIMEKNKKQPVEEQ